MSGPNEERTLHYQSSVREVGSDSGPKLGHLRAARWSSGSLHRLAWPSARRRGGWACLGRQTPLLQLRSAPECRPRPDLLGDLRPDTGLPVGSNQSSHLLEGLDREHGAHLRVARLVALHAGDGPQFRKHSGAVAVDGQGELAWKQAGRTVHAVAVPLDPTVPAGDDREPFGIGLNAEPVRLSYRPQLLNGALALRHLSRTRLSDH